MLFFPLSISPCGVFRVPFFWGVGPGVFNRFSFTCLVLAGVIEMQNKQTRRTFLGEGGEGDLSMLSLFSFLSLLLA